MACRPGNANLDRAEGGCEIRDIGHGFDSTGKYEIVFDGAGVEIPLMMRERWPSATGIRASPRPRRARKPAKRS